jgi:hypothetical protein
VTVATGAGSVSGNITDMTLAGQLQVSDEHPTREKPSDIRLPRRNIFHDSFAIRALLSMTLTQLLDSRAACSNTESKTNRAML